jgi:uncharacterized protein (DUF4415 family)
MAARSNDTKSSWVDPDDAPELTDAQLAEADIYEGDKFVRHGRVGRPRGSGKKELVTLRLDRDVLDRFRAGGPGWQPRLNDALRAATPASAEKVRAKLKEVHFAPRLALPEREIVSTSGRPLSPATSARPAAARDREGRFQAIGPHGQRASGRV